MMMYKNTLSTCHVWEMWEFGGGESMEFRIGIFFGEALEVCQEIKFLVVVSLWLLLILCKGVSGMKCE